jgi:Helix-turn-helix domain
MKENYINNKVQFVTNKEFKNVTKKAKKIERPELIISEEESRLRAIEMMKFLSLIHPQNVGEGYKNPIEIKFLLRGEGSTTTLGGYFTLYRLDSESELERLAQKIHECFKFSHCMYVSLFTFDRKKEVKVKITDRNGKATFEHKELNKIVRENAVETSVLPMDFDNISKEEYEHYRNYFKHLGIETLGVFTGYGYQMYILLNKPVKTKNTFEKFTMRLVELGLPIDTSITDPSRVFRMAFSRNCKSYSSEFKYYSPYNPEGIETTVIDWCVQRYNKKEIFNILDKEIARMNPVEETQELVTDVLKTDHNKVFVEAKKAQNKPSESPSKYEQLYKYLSFSEQPSQIQNILKGTEPGYRNASVLYLTPYLNNTLGLTQEQALHTLETFNQLCTPSMPDDKLKSDYYRFSEAYGHFKKGKYGPEMIEKFGREEKDTLIYTDFDEILFDNGVIKQFAEIHPSAIKLYLTMKLMEVQTEKNQFTKEEIAAAASVSEKTVQRYIKELTKKSIVVNVKGNNKQGIKKGYRINHFGAYIDGFTKLGNMLVESMINRLEPLEIVLYVYFMFKSKSMNKTMIFTSQHNIAKDVGLTQQAISSLTNELKKKGYIKKETIMGKQHRKKTTYTLRNN